MSLLPPAFHNFDATIEEQTDDLSKFSTATAASTVPPSYLPAPLNTDHDSNPLPSKARRLKSLPVGTPRQRISDPDRKQRLSNPKGRRTLTLLTLPTDRPPEPLQPLQANNIIEVPEENRSGIREKEDANILIGSVVGRQWLVDKKIAAGSFGTLFIGRHVRSRDNVAIKAERKDASYPQLHREYKFYQMLSTYHGIPKLMFYGQCATGFKYQIMVMELLGPNLEDLLQLCGGSFTVKTVCMVAIQLISLLEYVHSKGILYRDIKSENFLLGRPGDVNEDVLHVVDFGLSKEYINSHTGQHIMFNAKKGSVGTPRYMSINALQHHEQGRRDDLEALSYLLLYFLMGQLPWQGLPGSTFAEKCKKILEQKLRLSIDQVCEGAPAEFGKFMRYSRSLEYMAEPDYEACRGFFADLLVRLRLPNDGQYDWRDAKANEFWKQRKQYLHSLPDWPQDINVRINAVDNKEWSAQAAFHGGTDVVHARNPRMSALSRKARVDRMDSIIQHPHERFPVVTPANSDYDCCPCYPKRLRRAKK